MTTCSPGPVWESTAMADYRWQCACGHRYGNATPERGDVNAQHAAHLEAVTPRESSSGSRSSRREEGEGDE